MALYERKNNLPEHIVELSYKISTEPMAKVPPSLEGKMEQLHHDAQKGRFSTIEKLRKLIVKYPKEATLKNYLYVAYKMNGKDLLAKKVLEDTIEKHPDYLFGKINLAAQYLKEGELDKVTDIMGEHMELKMLCPERDTFHFSEVSSFLKVAVLYFIEKGELDQAEMRYKMMEEIAPDQPDTKMISNKLMIKRMEINLKRMQAAQAREIEVESFPTITFPATITAPEFHHPIINKLYEVSITDIEDDLINEILTLPKESLIADLEMVLMDSIQRYNHLKAEYLEDGIYQQYAPVHALLFLTELKSYSSLDIILNVLRQGEVFLEDWYGDMLSELFEPPIYILGHNQFEKLKAYLIEPHNYKYARTTVARAIEQVGHHQPKRHSEVLELYREVLQNHFDNPDKEGIIDSWAIANIVSGIVALRGKELLKEIEQVWENGWMTELLIGDLDTIKEDLTKVIRPYDLDPMPENIFEHYSGEYNERRAPLGEEERAEFDKMLNDKDLKTFTDLMMEVEASEEYGSGGIQYDYEEADYEEVPRANTAIRQGPKVGRNAPCPCGSGKKYKQCCLRK